MMISIMLADSGGQLHLPFYVRCCCLGGYFFSHGGSMNLPLDLSFGHTTTRSPFCCHWTIIGVTKPWPYLTSWFSSKTSCPPVAGMLVFSSSLMTASTCVVLARATAAA